MTISHCQFVSLWMFLSESHQNILPPPPPPPSVLSMPSSRHSVGAPKSPGTFSSRG